MYKNQDLKSLEIKEYRKFSLSVLQANADSVHYLAVAEAEELAASWVRYSRSSLAAWKRP